MPTATQAQLDATLISYDKKPVRIGDLLGKPLVLAFFPAAFTGVCTREMCTFRDSLGQFNAVDAQVYGVSVDLPDALRVFAEQQNLNFPLLSDANREAVRGFEVVWPKLSGIINETANRAVFVLDAEGTITYRWVGENPGQEPPYSEVVKAVGTARN